MSGRDVGTLAILGADGCLLAIVFVSGTAVARWLAVVSALFVMVLVMSQPRRI